MWKGITARGFIDCSSPPTSPSPLESLALLSTRQCEVKRTVQQPAIPNWKPQCGNGNMGTICRDPERADVAQYLYRLLIPKRIRHFLQTCAFLFHLGNGGGGISHNKAFNFWVLRLRDWGGGRTVKGPFPAWFAGREKPGRGRRGGRATSPGKVQGLPLTSAPNTARSRIHTLTPVTCLRPESGRVSSLSWPGWERDYHPSTAWQRKETSNWTIFQVSFEDRFFFFLPEVKGHLVGSQFISWPPQPRVWRRYPTHSLRNGQRAFVQLTLKSVKLNKTLRLVIGGKYQLKTRLTPCHTFPSSRVFLWKNKQENPIETIPDFFWVENPKPRSASCPFPTAAVQHLQLPWTDHAGFFLNWQFLWWRLKS